MSFYRQLHNFCIVVVLHVSTFQFVFMKQTVFQILPKPASGEVVDTHVSFNMFVTYLEERFRNEKTLRKRFYEFVLGHFHKHPEVLQPISLGDLPAYTGLTDLLYACLFPPLSDEQQVLWALSAPNSDTIFASTPAFYELMSPDNPQGMAATASDAEAAMFHNSLEQVQYALILERLYGIQPFVKDEIMYVWTDKITGLPRYYSIQIDNRFVQVHQTTQLPETSMDLKKQLKSVKSLCEMGAALPLSAFRFEGFSIITATDITAKHSLHKMRSALIRHAPENYEETYDRILFLLQVLCGSNKIRFGLLPFLKLNDRLVAFYESYTHSIAINIGRQQKMNEPVFLNWINAHFQDPKVVLYKDFQNPAIENDVFYKAFAQAGVKAYALLPVYHNTELAGLLEVSTIIDETLKEKILPRLEAAMPILAQLMHNHQAEFRTSIDKVIKMSFTSIQPSVQWKFNEVAWQYLKSKESNAVAGEMETIRFDDVYPLYGAIDIRNSTIERNNALHKDMQSYFSLLNQTLHAIYPDHDSTVSDLMTEAEDLQQQTSVYLSENDETGIIKFMERIRIFLQSHAVGQPGFVPAVSQYFDAMDPASGEVHEHRRSLEKSIQIINNTINKFLDQAQTEFQQLYPVYFEKFRTDGVEYDIYIGQSIQPHQPYKEQYLLQLRLWQLRTMANIAKHVHASTPLMPVKLHTTQLVYVNANSIDISFRTDEKRFDAEGSYNIRYHIVKKRIDKVHVKFTDERLTQPGKIAIVYSQKEHEEEYMQYIAQLQQEGLLVQGVEVLELEELQGVNGLKALRVGVCVKESEQVKESAAVAVVK